MARTRRGQSRLSVDEVRLMLPDLQVIDVRRVLVGRAFTEIQTVAWAAIHVLGHARTHVMERAGPSAAAAGWGIRSRQAGKGWLYFATRRTGDGHAACPIAF